MCAFILTLFWRIPWNGQLYHGLEYEDSYVYTVAARQVLERTPGNEAPAGFPYSISTCEVGSLKRCREWQTYPEHLIGAAYVISAYLRIMGYTPDAGGWVAVCAACMSCCLIVLIASLISSDMVVAVSAALIFVMTPIFAVQGLESSAEPVSNTAISVVVFLLVYLLRDHSDLGLSRAILGWVALTISIAFAMTVKRENSLLLIVVPILLLTMKRRGSTTGRRRKLYVIGVISTAAICGLFAWRMNLAHTGDTELSLINQFKPTLGVVFRIVLAFLSSFSAPEWYFFGFILVVWGMISSRHERLSPAVTSIFLCFVTLYALHVRGYYELRSGTSDPRAALRFEMSLMSLWSILGGLGVAAAFRHFRFPRRRSRVWVATVTCVLSGLCLLSYLATQSLRMDGVEDEAKVRVEPAINAARLASGQNEGGSYIITFEPLVVQMYADPATKVLDIGMISRREIQRLGLLGGTTHAIVVDEDIHHSAADADRYSEQLSLLSGFRKRQIYRGHGFAIARIDLPFINDGEPDVARRGQY